jgi:hypothetical protein
MAYTVIAVYDNYDRAEGALNALVAHGFERHKLHLGLIEDTPVGRAAALRALDQADEQSMNRLTLPEFFGTLFGQQDKQGDVYLEAVRRGGYVLMANAENDQEADQAMDVMARHHPLNIDEYSSRWRRQGWSKYDPGAAAMTQEEVELERSAITEEKPSLPLEQVQGFPIRDDVAEPATPIPRNEAQRLGVRLYQRGF